MEVHKPEVQLAPIQLLADNQTSQIEVEVAHCRTGLDRAEPSMAVAHWEEGVHRSSPAASGTPDFGLRSWSADEWMRDLRVVDSMPGLSNRITTDRLTLACSVT